MNFLWFQSLEFIEFDISKTADWDNLFQILILHFTVTFCMEGHSNYDEIFHLEVNLFHQYNFLKNLIKNETFSKYRCTFL